MARMLPVEAELVSELTGLPGRGKSVKRFEQSNGQDIALYKNDLFFRCLELNLNGKYPDGSLWTHYEGHIYLKATVMKIRPVNFVEGNIPCSPHDMCFTAHIYGTSIQKHNLTSYI